MGLWSDRALPHIVDKACSTGDIMKLRVTACEGLQGRVLEIGFGSGLNIPIYPDAVKEVAAVEPADVAWQMSQKRRERSGVPIERSGLDGQCLLEHDGSCDSALSTFTLCTIPDAVQALREVRRVLKPGGSFHFLEHGRAPTDGVQAWQRRLEPIQRRMFGGCHLTRHIPSLLVEAGFEVVELAEDYLPGPAFARPFGYGYVGRAVAA
jgi:ubiquinone/menaquinone biosynthesis C-methylase UbiE